MTKEIFYSWLKEFNVMMKQQNRHVILLLDNFSGHRIDSYSNVRVEFFPPNMTSHVQPCDAGIIKAFKDYFRAQMNKRIFERVEAVKSVEHFVKEVTVFDACDWTLEALKSVKKSTVINCFYKCKIVSEKAVVEETLVKQAAVGVPTSVTEDLQDYFCFDDDADLGWVG